MRERKNEDNAFLFSFFDPECLVSIPESSGLGRPSLLSAFDNVFFFWNGALLLLLLSTAAERRPASAPLISPNLLSCLSSCVWAGGLSGSSAWPAKNCFDNSMWTTAKKCGELALVFLPFFLSCITSYYPHEIFFSNVLSHKIWRERNKVKTREVKEKF